MRLSEQHDLTRPPGSDWFDANVEMVTPLYGDRFLVRPLATRLLRTDVGGETTREYIFATRA